MTSATLPLLAPVPVLTEIAQIVDPAWLQAVRGAFFRRMMRIMGRILLGFVVFLLAGNLLILGLTWWARATTDVPAGPAIDGVGNFQVVDDQVWRGAAPTIEGFEALAASGVTTIIDLRAEDDLAINDALFMRLGLHRVHIPIRDGQAPEPAEVQQFLDVVGGSSGKVFVHCGAGVGRTGTMVASYLVSTGQANGVGAMRRNLAVGPPSLEQLAFAARLSGGTIHDPPAPVVALSRMLDAPRRTWISLFR